MNSGYLSARVARLSSLMGRFPGAFAASLLACSCAAQVDGEQSTSDVLIATEPLVVNCKAGFKRVCEIDTNGKPFCDCEAAGPLPVSGTIVPSFYVTDVIYGPPGKASSIAYSSGETIGSTTAVSSSFKKDVKLTAMASALAGTDGMSLSFGQSWGSTDTSTADLALTQNSGYKKTGQGDLVDHGDDEIWFIINPVLNVSVTPKSATTAAKVTWQFAKDQSGALPFWVYVKELTDPSTWMGAEGPFAADKMVLDRYNITLDYYAQLLAADPWDGTNGEDPADDPDRFDLIDIFPYKGPSASGNQPSTQTFAVSRALTNSTTHVSDYSYSTGLGYTVGGSFFDVIKASLALSETWTWTSSTSIKTSTADSTGSSLTIGQPAFGYDGPEFLRVYEDKIWKTYVFQLDYF